MLFFLAADGRFSALNKLQLRLESITRSLTASQQMVVLKKHIHEFSSPELLERIDWRDLVKMVISKLSLRKESGLQASVAGPSTGE